MVANKILLNNIEIDNISELVAANLGSSYPVSDVINYLPYNDGNLTMVPLSLLVSMFGLSIVREENTGDFIVKRGKKEIRLEKEKYMLIENNYDLVPLKIFTQVFGIKGEWLDDETLNIVDPLTFPYYAIFNKTHSINKINQVFLFDLDEDGKNEMYIVYYDEELLQLAVFNIQGDWLYDGFLKGFCVFEMVMVQTGRKKAVIIITGCGAHTTLIYVFTLDRDRLVNIDTLDLWGSGKVVGNEIHNIYRNYDTADHGIKIIYGWEEALAKFIKTGQEIFFWFDDNRVDLKNAESVVYGFCEALALDLEKEALSYCSSDVCFAFSKEGLKYSIKDPIINIRRMIDSFKCRSFDYGKLKVQEQDSTDDYKLFIAYYSDDSEETFMQVSRLVLKKAEDKWRILNINFLGNQLPTGIRFAPELNFKPVLSIFTLFPCYGLNTEYLVNVNLSFRYPNSTLAFQCFIDRCSTVELVELFPGVQFSFFRRDLRLCYFTLENAQEVIIAKKDYEINIIVSLRTLATNQKS